MKDSAEKIADHFTCWMSREVLSKLVSGGASEAQYFATLKGVSLDTPQNAAMVVGACVAFVINNGKLPHDFVNYAAGLIETLLQSPLDLVRETSVGILAALAGTDELDKVVAILAKQFANISVNGQRTLLRIATMFDPPMHGAFRLLLTYAENMLSGNSKDVAQAFLDHMKRADVHSSPHAHAHHATHEHHASPASPKHVQEPSAAPAEFVKMLESEDWEEKEKGVKGLAQLMETNQEAVAAHAKSAALNLMDAIESPRTILENDALSLAFKLFDAFPEKLEIRASKYVTMCLDMVCSSHQFIADGAWNIMKVIAEKVDRSRILNVFVHGTKHRNPISRAKACTCLLTLTERGSLNDEEYGMVMSAFIPLLRDNAEEARESSKNGMRLLMKDERWEEQSHAIVDRKDDYFAMMQNIN